jgi:hypothetical protein
MFTIIAFLVIAGIAWYAERANASDRSRIITQYISDDEVRAVILHARQDIKLIVFLLMGILLMLGFVADRIH